VDAATIEQAEAMLRLAARRQELGRFQLEAAIQSIHAQRAHTGQIHWPGIAMMYAALLHHTPALGAHIGHAIAVAQVQRTSGGTPPCSRPCHQTRCGITSPDWAALVPSYCAMRVTETRHAPLINGRIGLVRSGIGAVRLLDGTAGGADEGTSAIDRCTTAQRSTLRFLTLRSEQYVN